MNQEAHLKRVFRAAEKYLPPPSLCNNSNTAPNVVLPSSNPVPYARILSDELRAPESRNIPSFDSIFQVPDRATMIRELEQRKLRNTKASVAFGSAKVVHYSELQYRFHIVCEPIRTVWE